MQESQLKQVRGNESAKGLLEGFGGCRCVVHQSVQLIVSLASVWMTIRRCPPPSANIATVVSLRFVYLSFGVSDKYD